MKITNKKSSLDCKSVSIHYYYYYQILVLQFNGFKSDSTTLDPLSFVLYVGEKDFNGLKLTESPAWMMDFVPIQDKYDIFNSIVRVFINS